LLAIKFSIAVAAHDFCGVSGVAVPAAMVYAMFAINGYILAAKCAAERELRGLLRGLTPGFIPALKSSHLEIV
jgi:hypothetical protein